MENFNKHFVIVYLHNRHPKKEVRPTFKTLSYKLSRPDFLLLLWSEEDRLVNSEVDKLGAHLEVAEDLYSDLQKIYQGYS